MLTFDPERHVYTEDGQEIPSVTQVIRFLNVDKAAKADPWLRDAAADRGTRIHEYCMLADYEELPNDVDYDCVGYVNAYLDFLRDYTPVWAGIERIVSGGPIESRYAGTVDRYGELMGLDAVVDIKTGSSINKLSCGAQLFAYATSDELGLWHRRSQKSRALFVLHLFKDGTYKLIDYNSSEISTAAQAWRCCAEINGLMAKKGRTKHE